VTQRCSTTCCLLLLAVIGCKGADDPVSRSPEAELSRARELLQACDLGPRFQEGIAALRALPEAEGVGKDAAMDAFLLRAEALTDLFIAARATGDPELAETLEAVTDWELKGDLSRPRNIQILAQEIQETFELVHRELGDNDPRRARAEAMARLLRDVQAVVFVRKDRLIQTLAELDTAFGGRYAHLAAAVRIGELVRPGPRTWRDHVLSTLALPCPGAVGGLMAALCVPDPEAETPGPCLLEGVVHEARRREAAGEALRTRCKDLPAADGEPAPQAAIRAWYRVQLETLRTADAPFAAWIRVHHLDAWEAGLDDALAPALALTQSD